MYRAATAGLAARVRPSSYKKKYDRHSSFTYRYFVYFVSLSFLATGLVMERV